MLAKTIEFLVLFLQHFQYIKPSWIAYNNKISELIFFQF